VSCDQISERKHLEVEAIGFYSTSSRRNVDQSRMANLKPDSAEGWLWWEQMALAQQSIMPHSGEFTECDSQI
jgi:hypothetical protein